MRWLTGVLAAACLLAGCGGSSGPHLVTKPGHTRFLTACASADCGPNVIVLSWSNINFPGTTGYNLFANGTQVGTAASSPYTFSGLDCNTAFTLGVQAHDGSGGLSQLFTTPYTSPACPVAPANTALPVVSGATTQGSVLSATNGTWTGSPTSFAYQWMDCNTSGAACVNIAGATLSAYTLQAADVGDTIRVVVTASNTFGSTPATSAQTAVIAASAPSGCAFTASTVATIQADVSAATDGQVVCVSATGSPYGPLSLSRTGTHTTDVVVEPVLGTDPNGAGKVTFASIGIADASNHLTIRDFYVSTGGISGSGTEQHVTVDHNDVQNPSGYGIAFASVAGNSQFITVSGNTIHNTCASCEGDALRFGWNDHLTVIGNDVYNIVQPGAFHTDTFQDFDNGWGTGVVVDALTVTKNYVHDNNNMTEGFPFLKDGDFTNVQITDNLIVRQVSGSTTGIANLQMCSGTSASSTIISNNSDIGGFAAQSYNGAPASARCPPHGTVSHNVLTDFNSANTSFNWVFAFDHNIWEHSPFTYSIGATDTINASPTFKCGGACGSGGSQSTPVGPNDDYELASNPNGIGIDWNPDATTFGPANPVS